MIYNLPYVFSSVRNTILYKVKVDLCQDTMLLLQLWSSHSFYFSFKRDGIVSSAFTYGPCLISNIRLSNTLFMNGVNFSILPKSLKVLPDAAIKTGKILSTQNYFVHRQKCHTQTKTHQQCEAMESMLLFFILS